MDFLFVIYVACAALGSTFAIAALSSGSGRLPRLVMAWPFIVVLGSIAVLGPVALAGILRSFYTVAALAFFAAAAVAAVHHHRVDSARPIGVTATVLMTMAMPLVGALALWGVFASSWFFFTLLGFWMPLLAVLTRLNHLRSDAVLAVFVAASFAFVLLRSVPIGGEGMVSETVELVLPNVPYVLVGVGIVVGVVGIRRDGHLSSGLKKVLYVVAVSTALHCTDKAVSTVVHYSSALPNVVLPNVIWLTCVASTIAALAGFILHDIRQAANPPEEPQTCSGVPAAQ